MTDLTQSTQPVVVLAAPAEQLGVPLPWTCGRCKTIVGHVVKFEDKRWMQIGPWLVSRAYLPKCPKCGHPVVFGPPSEEAYQRLMAHYKTSEASHNDKPVHGASESPAP